MKVQPVVKHDTLRLAVGMLVPVALTLLGFWIAGHFDYTVVLGVLLGYAATVVNFFLLAMTVQLNAEAAQREAKKNPPPEEEPAQDTEDAETERDMLETVMGKKAKDNLPDYALRAKRNTHLSYLGRMAMLAACLLIGVAAPCFHVVAVLIPIVLQRYVLMVLSATNKEK